MTKDEEPWRDVPGHTLTTSGEPPGHTPARQKSGHDGQGRGLDVLWLLVLAAVAATVVGACLALDA